MLRSTLLRQYARLTASKQHNKFDVQSGYRSFAVSASSSASETLHNSHNDAEQEFMLGVQHLLGKANTPSASTKSSVHYAILHWTNAAEKGHVKAQSALGNLYLKGHDDVQRNEKLGHQFLQQAADAGHEGSCHEIGKLYFHGGEEIFPNHELALKYWSLAAEKGHMAASFDLGHLYAHGIHVEKDEAKSIDLFKQAAAKGMAEAHWALGNAYLYGRGTAQDAEKGIKRLKIAAESGHAQAQFDLGACYMLGRGVETPDLQQAAQMFFLAAEAGIPQAQLCMAQLFEHGRGIQADREKSVQYYRMAATNGMPEGKQALDRLGEPLEDPNQAS